MDVPPANYPLLESIDSPADLRRLPAAKLTDLAQELRQFLIHSVAPAAAISPPAWARSSSPSPCIMCSTRPMTGWSGTSAIRPIRTRCSPGAASSCTPSSRMQGLAPFPTRSESEYDTFGVGHSSTSISAALGMAVAAAQRGEDRRAVAIIGDGALTAGMAFEALNHAGSLPTDLLIVLNDNDMSISENVGALSNYLARALSGRMYSHLRESGKKVLRQMPTVWELARRSEEHLKGMVLPGTLFEEMGFNYIGPIDGHDVKALVSTLRNLQEAARARSSCTS